MDYQKIVVPTRMNLPSNSDAQVRLTTNHALNEQLVAPDTALTTLF